MKRNNITYISPRLIPLVVRVERGFGNSTDGFDRDEETDAGWL